MLLQVKCVWNTITVDKHSCFILLGAFYLRFFLKSNSNSNAKTCRVQAPVAKPGHKLMTGHSVGRLHVRTSVQNTETTRVPWGHATPNIFRTFQVSFEAILGHTVAWIRSTSNYAFSTDVCGAQSPHYLQQTCMRKVRSAEEFIKPRFSRNTDKSSYIALLNFKVLICSMIYNTFGINSYQVCLHWWGISSSY